MSNKDYTETVELLSKEILEHSEERCYRLSKLFSFGIGKKHTAQYPNSPICQWNYEMKSTPQLFWYERAIRNSSIKAYCDAALLYEWAPKNQWIIIRLLNV